MGEEHWQGKTLQDKNLVAGFKQDGTLRLTQLAIEHHMPLNRGTFIEHFSRNLTCFSV